MGEKYKTPTIDWTSAGDLSQRFQMFRQKCQLIFDGPLSDKGDDYKIRMLLLWCDDKGLKIYTARWAETADALARVWDKNLKPTSRLAATRYSHVVNYVA